jgi:transcriptional regulator of arginine metabolism
MAESDTRSRLDALRELLREGTLSTQEELRDKLQKMKFDVTQSTISRDLRKIAAIKAIDPEGRTIYRLSEEEDTPVVTSMIADLVYEIEASHAMVVIHTSPGTASLVAKHLDRVRPAGLIGTIAGEDTIFVAPHAKRSMAATVAAIRESLGLGSKRQNSHAPL